MTISLQCKLASIVVHAEEFITTGHPFDRAALDTVLNDAEVKEWLKDMGPLVPVKR